MKDRAMQALYLQALEPIAETTADPNSYGFRKGRGCADAIEQCFATHCLVVVTRNGYSMQTFKGCFDNISHEWLMEHIPMEKSMLNKWLKAGYMEKSMLHPTDEGTPQGGIISPVLMNMALDGLEKQLRERYPFWRIQGKLLQSEPGTFMPMTSSSPGLARSSLSRKSVLSSNSS